MRKREEKKVYTHNIQSERGVRTTLWHTSLDVVPRWKMLPSHAFKNLWLFFSLSLPPSISSPSLVVYSIHKIVFRFFFFFFFVPRGVDNRFSPYMASRIIFPLSVVDLWIATVADAIALRSGRRWVGGGLLFSLSCPLPVYLTSLAIHFPHQQSAK